MISEEEKGKGVTFSAQEWLRYQRHIQLPQFSVAGQTRLKQARVLIVGVGGLGCPAAQYLAAAGVGHITLVDGDVINISNLQRQILFTHADRGKSKAAVAQARLEACNPDIDVVAQQQNLSVDNAPALIAGCDLVLDCTDNFHTRYLINDLCVEYQKPWVYGSVLGFAGQLAVFMPGKTCFRCVFPEASEVADCNQAGVLGVIPGMIGLLQATEVIKYLAGLSGSLENKMLLVDSLSMQQRSIKLVQEKNCTICSGKENYRDKISDYQFFCQAEAVESFLLSPEQVLKKQSQVDCILVDVRTDTEHHAFNLGGEWVPVDTIAANKHGFSPDKTYILYCQSGMRSEKAVRYLLDAGFKNTFSLAGGLSTYLEVLVADKTFQWR
ncbi:MAG: HesA/MoeB/ThiF family protein [Pseudomonadales bacterium]